MILPQDKLYHLGAGVLVALMGSVLFSPIIGLGLAVLAGIAKEGFDFISNKLALKAGKTPVHSVDPMDAIATALGGVAVFIVLSI